VVSFLRLLNKPVVDVTVATSTTRRTILIGVIVTGLILLAGYFTQNNSSINWLILPLLTVPAAALPIWLILRQGIKDLPLGSRWRAWGILGLSMSFTPFLLLVLEVVVIIIVFILGVLYVVATPQLSMEFQRLFLQFRFIDPRSDEIMKLIAPYLTKPGTVAMAFTLFSLVIPMIEEVFKPLGVWLLSGKLDSPAQGFAFGALCGAGFALVETLNVSGQSDGWVTLLTARIGTGAMHITTSALMGAAIVSTFREKRYLRLFGTYLLAVLLHGTWNAAALANGFSSVLAYEHSNRAQTLFIISTTVLVVLALGLIAILISANWFHRKNKGRDLPETAPGSEGNKSV
jgi:RsiW-degrading membrane proteinase PrsW (M82 family)